MGKHHKITLFLSLGHFYFCLSSVMLDRNQLELNLILQIINLIFGSHLSV